MFIRKVALRIGLLFFCGSLRLLCWAEQPSVDEILKRVSETYQNLQSYQFVAEEITEIESVQPVLRLFWRAVPVSFDWR